MPRVIMQPSYGRGITRKRWERTLGTEIQFTERKYVDALRPGDLDRLFAMHPAGRARFWGATRVQNLNYDRKMSTGDVVLFTGSRQVRAVGQVGVILRDAAAFGDLLWDPDPKNGSFCNIYSVQGFGKVAIPYEEIWALPGFKLNNWFQGLWPLDADRTQTVLEALRIELPENPQPDPEEDRRLSLLARSMGQVTAAEEFTKASTSYERAAGTVIVNRAESLLITAYRDSLPGTDQHTLRVPTGLADYYAEGPSGSVLVEAKSSAKHKFVRQALSQLLDYVRFSRTPATSLAALFPQCPADLGVELLHYYGVDCIFLDADGGFTSLPAPAARRRAWQRGEADDG
jgi:hypothetical protein